MTKKQSKKAVDHEGYLLEMQLLREHVPSFKEYPFNIPAVKKLKSLRFHPGVTFLAGENGSGKSTIIEAIAVAARLNPEGGSINFNFATRASESDLFNAVRLVRAPRWPKDSFFLRAESFYNVATQVEQLGVGGYGGASLHEQSHGESFIATILNRFRGDGLYILDEPESALSPTRQLALLAAIRELTKKNSQFIIATHSPILLGYPEAQIFELNDKGIKEIQYFESQPYVIYKSFLSNREKMLRELFEETDEVKESEPDI